MPGVLEDHANMAWLSCQRLPHPTHLEMFRLSSLPADTWSTRVAIRHKGILAYKKKNNKTSEEQRYYKDDKLKSQHQRKQN